MPTLSHLDGSEAGWASLLYTPEQLQPLQLTSVNLLSTYIFWECSRHKTSHVFRTGTWGHTNVWTAVCAYTRHNKLPWLGQERLLQDQKIKSQQLKMTQSLLIPIHYSLGTGGGGGGAAGGNRK